MTTRNTLCTAIALSATAIVGAAELQPQETTMNDTSKQEDHYTFTLADGVTRTKVHFKNHFGIELTGDLYLPADAARAKDGKLPALAVCGPFGAVKEQASGLYANRLAALGFAAMAFDPSFTGESGGEPRYMNSPDINTEDFMAAVDFLTTREDFDPERVGIVGICGWGGMALNTAAIDTRIKATLVSTMYDISRVTANGYFDAADSEEARHAARVALMAQRTEDFKAVSAGGAHKLAGGLPDERPAEEGFVQQYWDYYKTPRGYAERSLNSNGGWCVTAATSLLNAKLLAYSKEIRSAVLVMHGEKAHSRYFGEDAYRNMTDGSTYAANKELLIVPGATHCDLYDGGEGDFIPWAKIVDFFETNLK